MSKTDVVALVLFLSLFTFVIWRRIVLFLRGEILSQSERLENWASKNEVKIVSTEQRLFLKGPFSWQRRGGVVFRVKAVDRETRSRDAWVCLYYRFSGEQGTEHYWDYRS